MVVPSGIFNVEQDLVAGSMISDNSARTIARTSTQG